MKVSVALTICKSFETVGINLNSLLFQNFYWRGRMKRLEKVVGKRKEFYTVNRFL